MAKKSFAWLLAWFLAVILASIGARLSRKQDGTNKPGADQQANIGSTVADPAFTASPNAERVPPEDTNDERPSEKTARKQRREALSRPVGTPIEGDARAPASGASGSR